MKECGRHPGARADLPVETVEAALTMIDAITFQLAAMRKIVAAYRVRNPLGHSARIQPLHPELPFR